jgi:transcriptional antiterminator NusG
MYYVIQVKTGKEQQAIEDILKNKPDDASFDVFSPYRKSFRKYKGVMREVVERCFPGYIFVETNDVQRLFKQLYFTPGFQKILGREGDTDNFVPLDKDESRMIDILYSANNNRITEISNIEVKEGETIRVLDGPLVGLETQIKKVNLHKRTVLVEFMMCGRLVTAPIGINIITNIINK